MIDARIEPLPLAPGETLFERRRDPALSSDERGLFGVVPRSDADWRAAASEFCVDRTCRTALVAWLERIQIEAPAHLLRRVADPKVKLVMSGQQPALAGGPLMLAVKLQSLVALAGYLERIGVPAQPIFWIADDDHDVGELSSGLLPRAGATAEPALANPFGRGRVPLGELTLPAETRARFVELAAELRAHGVDSAAAALEQSWDPSPAIAFERLLGALLPESGVLFVRASRFRPAFAVEIDRERERAGQLAREVRAASARMQAAGLPVIVDAPAELPFFYHDERGERHRVAADPAGLRLENAAKDTITHAMLTAGLGDPRGRFSPDVLLRPLVEAAIFGPFAVVLGPTELAYQMQLAESYASRDVQRPLLVPRARAAVVSSRTARAFESAGLRLADLHRAAAAYQVAPSAQARRLALYFQETATPLVGLLDSLARDPATSHALARRSERLLRRLREDIDKFQEATLREVDDDVREARRVAEAALGELWPRGESAERTVSLLYYLREYGMDLLPALARAFDPNDERARLVIAEPLPRKEP